MNDPEDFGFHDPNHRTPDADQPRPRVVGSPLPMGGGGGGADEGDAQGFRQPPQLGRALATSSVGASAQQASSVDRAMGILQSMALPFMQRILPLLDGSINTAISNFLAPHPQAPPQPPVNLEPFENGLNELGMQHRDLRNQVIEQNSSLKRVEDQLEMVREATDRNTLEQQELLEDLKTVGNKVNAFALFALGLLAVSIFLNVVLYLHIRRVLP